MIIIHYLNLWPIIGGQVRLDNDIFQSILAFNQSILRAERKILKFEIRLKKRAVVDNKKFCLHADYIACTLKHCPALQHCTFDREEPCKLFNFIMSFYC